MDMQLGLDLLKRVATDVVVPRFRRLQPEQVQQKGPGDLVTIADQEAEIALTKELRRLVPGALVVGEEAVDARPELVDGLAEAEDAFLVDPVDGTGNFVRGSADFAVMIAQLRKGDVVRAWIWQPIHEQAFVAERGSGVFRNGEPLQRRPAQVPPRGETSRRAWRGFTADGRLAPIRSTTFCVGVDYPRLLQGETDFLAYKNPRPWDHLPGLLMLNELGGDIAHLNGRPYRVDSELNSPIIAATHLDVLDLAVDCFAHGRS